MKDDIQLEELVTCGLIYSHACDTAIDDVPYHRYCSRLDKDCKMSRSIGQRCYCIVDRPDEY